MATEKNTQADFLKKRITDFLKKCETRNGNGFKVTSLQYNGSGVPVTLKGTVNVKEEGQEKEITMYWNIEGRAMLGSTAEFDLIINETI